MSSAASEAHRRSCSPGRSGTDLTMWLPQADVLKPHFCTLRYDIRGHGASPVPPGPYSIDDLGG